MEDTFFGNGNTNNEGVVFNLLGGDGVSENPKAESNAPKNLKNKASGRSVLENGDGFGFSGFSTADKEDDEIFNNVAVSYNKFSVETPNPAKKGCELVI